ncbi:sin3 histone deacetylase corepressor complex component SDS3 [Topomyia yanbarensis]|uniref:sin3 histone deacetylase corepressor complex component SDS3 n=1 Tax=Topomyia yanbarensis TaxID=2498891 RepID=UPI00273C66A2|nr:sin3 histone deacetylase corepressor complex component SDS3 [Topomyia yanbarensis]
MSSSYGHMNNTNNSTASMSHHNNQHDYEETDGDADILEQDLFEEVPLLDEDIIDDSEEDTEEASETEMGSSNHRNIDEPIEIKEQMYQDKLASLKKQLEELRSGTHPEYLRRVKKLEHQYNERMRLNDIYREYLISCVERDYILEKNAAVKEYEEKKIDLRENLMTDFEDRRKMIENERATMELTGDSIDLKPTVTRKLRRRPNEPLPVPEKRRKPTSGQLVLLLDEKEVENDLKLISRGKPVQTIRPHTNSLSGSSAGNGNIQNPTIQSTALATISNSTPNNYQINNSAAAGNASHSNDVSISIVPSQAPMVVQHQNQPPVLLNSNNAGPHQGQSQNQNHQPPPLPAALAQSPINSSHPVATIQQSQQQQQQQQQQQSSQQTLVETKIEDGKLLYERRWFHRGQPVYVEGKDIPRFSANISAIGSEAIWVKKTADGQKVRIFTSQLSRGKVSIKRRAN